MSRTSLSANTLFHFTNSIENIINILTNDFTPRYCMESFDFISEEDTITELAIPMVCFCDIPLSQIRNHVEHYGGYAIGLSKNWGISNCINPVMYSLPDSYSTQIYRLSMNTIPTHIGTLKDISNSCKIKKTAMEKLQETIEGMNSSNLLQFYFSNYMKPYEGYSWENDSFSGDFVNFYDEREWRYVPDPYMLHNHGIDTYITKEEFLNSDYKDSLNMRIAEISKLTFTPNDIKYIIVNSEDEILTMCNQIDLLKGSANFQNDVTVLKTRIISNEQIFQDF
jgi:hypothetical protein